MALSKSHLPCLVLVEPRKRWLDDRLTWTDCDDAGDYVVPNVLSPRDLVFRTDNMDETVPHTTLIFMATDSSHISCGRRRRHVFSTDFDRICFMLAGNDDIHKSWIEFEIRLDPTTDTELAALELQKNST